MRISSTARINRAEERPIAEGKASFTSNKNHSLISDFWFAVSSDTVSYRVSMSRAELIELVRKAADEKVTTAEGKAIADGALAALAALLGD